MAQDILKPKDDGKIKLPSVDGGMNKLGPQKGSVVPKDAKGGKKYKKKRKGKIEPKVEATDDIPEKDEDDSDDFRDAVGDDGKSKKKSTMLGADDDEKSEDAEILARARKRFERCVSYEAENRKAGLEDLKFKVGEQWPPDIAAQRATDRRPVMTINKLPTIIHQVTNDQRQNRPQIDVSPVGDRGDVDVAKMLNGMLRSIQRDSSADIAYDTAFESAASNGWGYFRVNTEYEDQETVNNQVITIRRIRNPFTVYLDPSSQEPDGADAKFGFITEMISKSDFEDEYPNAQPVNFDMASIGETYKSWLGKDEVRVAEYYEFKNERRNRVALSNGAEIWEDEISEDTQRLIDDGHIEIEGERNVSVQKLMWYKITAIEILERTESVFRWVPICRVIGDETDIEGKVKYSGIVRNAKDAQRAYNYLVTMEAETTSLAPKAPFIVEEGQIEGHESQWKNANIRNYPYLAYKGTSVSGKPAPPPQRQPPVQASSAIISAKQGAAQDIMGTTGVRFDATLGERTQDQSGRALRELQRKGDVGAFHYMDNLARAMKHAGRMIVDAIPRVYDTKRTLMILREDGKEENVTLDPNAAKPFAEQTLPGGMKKQKIFNPTVGKYGVTVTIGPSYATKRLEAAESMIAFAKAMPTVGPLIADYIAKNMDWEGAEEIADRLAKALPPQLLTPEQKDVPPQLQAVMQHMQQQIQMLVKEREQLVAALKDKGADRAVDIKKIETDFESKILGIVEKANANANTHALAQFKEILKLTQGLNGKSGESDGAQK